MYRKRLLPYILELIVFLSILTVLIFTFTVTKSIVIQWSGISILLSVLIVIWFVQYIFSFVPFSLLATADFFSNKSYTIRAEFMEQYVFKSSSFLDRRILEKKDIKNPERLFYKVIVKTKEGVQIFTSSEYFELKQSIAYDFIIGKRSKALLDVKSATVKE